MLAVTPATGGGRYVETVCNDAAANCTGLAYYAPAALRSGDPRPTAYLPGGENAFPSVAGLADGGVVAVRSDGVVRWGAAGAALR